MKINTFLRITCVSIVGLYSSYSLAATFTPVENGHMYVNTSNTTDINGHFTSTLTGPSSAFTVSGENNPVLFAGDLATGLGTEIFNFSKTDVSGGLSGKITADNLFNGIVLKTSTVNFVALFDVPISSLYWNMLWSSDLFSGQNFSNPKELSHFSTFTSDIPEIPIPAALWLFAPALLGFMGFRRRISK